MSEDYSEVMIDWLTSWDKCWRCKRPGLWPNLNAHHFIRGSRRHKNDPREVVVLCYECHMLKEHGADPLGLLLCFALKRRMDKENWDLLHLNRSRGRADNAITEDEIDEAENSLVERGILCYNANGQGGGTPRPL